MRLSLIVESVDLTRDNGEIWKHYEVLQYSVEYQTYRIEIVYRYY